MMVFHTACIILLILFGISPQIVYSQNVVYVDYVESFNEMHDTNMVSLPIINKKNRAQWKFSGDKHKSLQVYTERTFHQRYLLVML